MTNEKTIEYYNSHAQSYFDETVSADMHETCDCFLKYVRPGGTIMDVGAGSGRDLKYFTEKGYHAEGIDASKELCALASEYAHAPAACVRIQDWIPEKRYDGIWASACLVHLAWPEIEAFIRRLPDLLEENGAAYISLKSGIKTGEDEKGRYFTDASEADLRSVIDEVPELETVQMWKSGDVMRRSGFHWVNVILKRKEKADSKPALKKPEPAL